jgi:hypothetical protein
LSSANATLPSARVRVMAARDLIRFASYGYY